MILLCFEFTYNGNIFSTICQCSKKHKHYMCDGDGATVFFWGDDSVTYDAQFFLASDPVQPTLMPLRN